MKKKLLFATGLSLMMISFHSCDELKNCQICSQNTYNSSNVLTLQENEAEYCDAELIAIKAKIPFTLNGNTTKWECR